MRVYGGLNSRIWALVLCVLLYPKFALALLHLGPSDGVAHHRPRVEGGRCSAVSRCLTRKNRDSLAETHHGSLQDFSCMVIQCSKDLA